MRVKDLKCTCGSKDLTFIPKSITVTGIYCKDCGRWLKWADKNEKNLWKMHKNGGRR